MRTPKEVKSYVERLEHHYLSEKTLTDVELHNVTIKINRAAAMYRNGLTGEQIKETLKKMDNDPRSGVDLNEVEKTRDKIQKYLIEKGYKGNMEEKENELLLKWALDG